ncbi:MAG: phytase, partial [Henriciella sp.]
MLKKSMHASRILALAATTSMFALMGCHTAYSQDDASIEAGVDSPMVVRGNSVAASDGQMEAAILVLGNDANAPASIVAATSMNGLEVSSLEGERIATMPAGEVIGLDVAYGFEIGGTSRTLIGAIDQASDSLRLFTLNSTGLQEVGSGAETFDYAAENVCFYRHALDGLHYAFIVGDGGQVAQNLLYETAGGKVSIRPVRQINVPSTIKQCVADAGSGTVFVSEESVGIWRFNADPESETGAAILDRVDRDHIDEEVGGLAVYDGGDDTR